MQVERADGGVTDYQGECGVMEEKLTPYEEAIQRINAGDATALDDYSRWTIYNASLGGRLKPPAAIAQAVEALLDSCRESI